MLILSTFDGSALEFDAGFYRVGKDPESDFYIDDPTVSPEHATVEAIDNQWILRDEYSINGTKVLRDNESFDLSTYPDREFVLRDRDTIVLGGTKVNVKLLYKKVLTDIPRTELDYLELVTCQRAVLKTSTEASWKYQVKSTLKSKFSHRFQVKLVQRSSVEGNISLAIQKLGYAFTETELYYDGGLSEILKVTWGKKYENVDLAWALEFIRGVLPHLQTIKSIDGIKDSIESMSQSSTALKELAINRLHEEVAPGTWIHRIMEYSILSLAEARQPVLLHGELGVGKTLVGKLLHNNSDPEGLFIPIDCRKGKGLLATITEYAPFLIKNQEIIPQPCTLLLENYENLSQDEISLILNLRQEFFVILTSRKPPAITGVKKLFIPTIHGVENELENLVSHFSKQYAIWHQKPVIGWSQKALEHLGRWHWPGNRRELRMEVERVLSEEDVEGFVEPKHLHPSYSYAEMPGTISHVCTIPSEGTLKERRQEVERILLRNIILDTGSKVNAAKFLNIPWTTFHSRLTRLGLV